MFDNSNYCGSQAFNNLTNMQEEVNKNTGSLSVKLKIIDLKGVTDYCPLAVSLIYNPSFNGVYGLPDGWQIDIPFVIPGASVSAGGTTYIIDDAWISQNGAQSGLKYENRLGIYYCSYDLPSPLPCKQPGEYTSMLLTQDGSICYFDGSGNPMMQTDRFGNFIVFNFSGFNCGPLTNSLESIIDSFGQTIYFSYNNDPSLTNSLTITHADNSTSTVTYNEQGVMQYSNQLAYLTTFSYDPDNGMLTTISYPTGLTTSASYTPLPALLADGSVHYFQAISAITHADHSGFLDKTGYVYGTNTFTGYAQNLVYSDFSDTLMSNGSQDYEYDVTLQSLDEQDNICSSSCWTYNYLHLPVYTISYGPVLNGEGQGQPSFQSWFTYNSGGNLAPDIPNFGLPTLSEQSLFIEEGRSSLPLARVIKQYDDYGQQILSQTYCCTYPSSDYILQSTKENNFTSVEWLAGFSSSMPLSEKFTDQITQSCIETDYQLTEGSLTICGKTIKDEKGNAWKVYTWTYDSAGRVSTANIAWAEGSSGPGNQSSELNYIYSYDALAKKLTVKTTDALNRSTQEIYRTDLPKGKIVQSINNLGQTTVTSRDRLGRIISVQDPGGNITYSTYSGNGTCQFTQLTPGKYQKTTILDGLGRKICSFDNSSASGANVILEKITYNPAGLMSSKTDRTGLITNYTYDALGRITDIYDPYGNHIKKVYNDAIATEETYLNTFLTQSLTRDGLSRILNTCVFSSDGTASPQQTIQNYDGYGEVYINQTGFLENGEFICYGSVVSIFNPERKVKARVTTSSVIGCVTITDNFNLDLFGNEISNSRDIVADNQTTSINSDIRTFDQAGQLTKITNLSGQETVFTYDPVGRLSSTTLPSGKTIIKEYDANGNVIALSSGTVKQYSIYDADNRLVNISDREGIALGYTWRPDGRLLSIDYGSGNIQSCTWSDRGQLSTLTDVAGVTTKFEYNFLSQLDSVGVTGENITNDNITFLYQTSAEVNGLLAQETFSGAIRHYSYDGFRRIAEVNTTGSTYNFRSALTYNNQWQIATSTSVSNENVSLTSVLSYDDLGHLLCKSDTTGSTAPVAEYFTYDVNANILSAGNGINQPKTFTYNDLNQSVGDNEAYDADGNMLKDGQGNIYTYDELNRLITFQDSNGKTSRYSYYPDNLLSSITTDGITRTLFYIGGQCNVISENNNSSVSFLNVFNRLIAAYKNNKDVIYYECPEKDIVALRGPENQTFSYNAYGQRQQLPEPGIETAFGWKGCYTDQHSGMIYMNARFYNPALRRFINADSLPVTNRYAFCMGDPLNYYDPTGHMAVKEWLMDIGLLIAGAIAIAIPVVQGFTVPLFFGAAAGLLGAVSGATGLAGGLTKSKSLEAVSTAFSIAAGIIGILGGGFQLLSGTTAVEAGAGAGAGAAGGAAEDTDSMISSSRSSGSLSVSDSYVPDLSASSGSIGSSSSEAADFLSGSAGSSSQPGDFEMSNLSAQKPAVFRGVVLEEGQSSGSISKLAASQSIPVPARIAENGIARCSSLGILPRPQEFGLTEQDIFKRLSSSLNLPV